MLAPLVYGSELGPVRLTVRRHFSMDGAGHESPHYDVISYEAPAIMAYEELTATKLNAYMDFRGHIIAADRTIGNTQLISLLEEQHRVSAKTTTMK